MTSTIGMLALVHGLTAAADQSWASPSVIASFVLAASSLVALVLTERRHGAPVVPPAFITSMSSAAPLLAMMLIPAGQFGFLYFAALYTQDVLGFSPLQTSLSVLPFTAGMTGLVWMSRLTPESGYPDGLFGPFLLLGLGAGLTITPLTAVIMHNTPPKHLSAASSLNQAMQQLGGAVGLAVLSTIYANTANTTTTSDTATGISTALTVAITFPLLALLLFAVWARRLAHR